MFIGYDVFNPRDSAAYQNVSNNGEYRHIEFRDMLLDEVMIDSKPYYSTTTDKLDNWKITTLLNAKLQGDLEAGSLRMAGLTVDKLRFSKRAMDDTDWHIVGDVDFHPGDIKEYKITDKNIRNGYDYEYSVVPMAQGIVGNRITSDVVQGKFEGFFLSDSENNYGFMYNIDNQGFNHNVGMHTLQTLNSPYPHVIFDNTNYISGSVSAIYIYDDNPIGSTDLQTEHRARKKLMNFLKNKKPKTMRFMNGETMIVSIVGQPVEQTIQGINKYMSISFEFVEIDSFDDGGIRRSNLQSNVESEDI